MSVKNLVLHRRGNRQAPPTARTLAAALVPIARGAAAILVVAAALLFWSRRAAGELVEPLSFGGMTGMALLLAAGSCLARRLVSEEPSRLDAIPARVALTLAGILALAAVTLPGASFVATAPAWLLFLVLEVTTQRGWSLPERSERQGPRRFWRVWLDEITRIDSPHPLSPGEAVANEAAPERPSQTVAAEGIEVARQVLRGRDPCGHDICFGAIRLDFAPGQRTEVAHIEFCPPFDTLPALSLETIDHPSDTAKAVQVYCHGAVVEVRLAERPESETTRQINFRAQA